MGRKAINARAARVQSHNSMVANLEDVLAASLPEHKELGLQWYPRARRTAYIVAAQTGLTFNQAAGVLAVMSPRVEWEYQVRFTVDFVRYVQRNGADSYADKRNPFRYGTHDGKKKAVRIIYGESVVNNLGKKAPKVRAFYANIIGEDGVTLDRHAIDAVVGRKLTDRERDAYINNATWRARAVKAYETVARRHGIKPQDAQAWVWVAWREYTHIDGVWTAPSI